MQIPGFFFNHVATIQAVARPQDASGGEVPTPKPVAVFVPCCVQQDAPGSPGEGQGRRGSTSDVTVFFRPASPPQVDAVEGLKVNDRIVLTGPTGRIRTITLDAPPFDAAGRSAVWEARGRDVR